MDETRFITFPFLPTLISSIDMDDPKEFDDPQVFHDPKVISIGFMDFDNSKVYGDLGIWGKLPLTKGSAPKCKALS